MIGIVSNETPFVLSFVFFFMGEQEAVRVLRAGDLVLSLFLVSSSGVMVEVLDLLVWKISEMVCCLSEEGFSFDAEGFAFDAGDGFFFGADLSLGDCPWVGGFKVGFFVSRGGKLVRSMVGAGAGAGVMFNVVNLGFKG